MHSFFLVSLPPDPPLACLRPQAQSYSNAGFALDYAEGKPYGGRWLQKPYGKKFAKARKPYSTSSEGYDVSVPLQFGPPPPPEAPKPPPPAYLAPYASVPQVSVYPEESSSYFGSPVRMPPLAAAFPPKSYRHPSLTQSFGSYAVTNQDLRLPSTVASSYGTLTPEESDLYVSSLAAAVSPAKSKKVKGAVVAGDLAAGLTEEAESGYKLLPSASKLIPNIVKSPFKKIMKAFSKNKLLSWKRKEGAKDVAKD